MSPHIQWFGISCLLILASLQWSTGLCKRPNILFLTCDSMDGRLLDPTDPQYGVAQLPLFTHLADNGVNFIRTYSNSPICVAGRCALMTGRYSHSTGCINNNMGFFLSPNGTIDENCESNYGADTCRDKGKEIQNNTGTWVEYFQSINYDVYMYGKMDIGGAILQDFNSNGETLVNGDGFHDGPQLKVCTRSSNVQKSVVANPSSSCMMINMIPKYL